ncbi:MAG: hypothetical protein E7141_00505 [Rikenellaceae bacterium]|nr:hypothetical protein [Rikenellaceae bacterium]
MRKFTSVLSLVALVASALFVSCAKEKTPDLVPAFPANKPASYAPNKSGEYVWTFDSAYSYTNARGGGFRVNVNNKSILDYVIAPNADWTVEVVGEGSKYLEVRYGYGYNEDNYTYGSSVSGPRGANTIGFRTTSAARETEVVCVVEMIMCGERMPIATLTLASQASAEQPEEPEQPEDPEQPEEPEDPENPEA